MAAGDFLARAGTVVVVDWPSRDVPESLARAGWAVFVHGGSRAGYTAYELIDGEVVSGRVGAPPEDADLVYAHRPLDELPGIVGMAASLGAAAVWVQSGRGEDGARDPRGCWMPEEERAAARQVVEAAGLDFVDQPYIGDAARGLAPR